MKPPKYTKKQTSTLITGYMHGLQMLNPHDCRWYLKQERKHGKKFERLIREYMWDIRKPLR